MILGRENFSGMEAFERRLHARHGTYDEKKALCMSCLFVLHARCPWLAYLGTAADLIDEGEFEVLRVAAC
jgi:hypothetical protein